MNRFWFRLVLCGFIALTACTPSEWEPCQKVVLDEGWLLRQADSDRSYPAKVPSTVLGTLVHYGLPHIDSSLFDKPWVYTCTFTAPRLTNSQFATLLFEGISYRANVWLNGEQLAKSKEMFGPTRQFSIDVTSLLQETNNTLEVEVYKAQPWEPGLCDLAAPDSPYDGNMGLFRPVVLLITGSVDVQQTVVHTEVNDTGKEADLILETTLLNRSDRKINGMLRGEVVPIPPAKKLSPPVLFSVPITLQPGERHQVRITSEDIPMLRIRNPQLWWCHGLGDPNLFTFDVQYMEGGTLLDYDAIPFGIRKVEPFYALEGKKGLTLNGVPVWIKGAHWSDDSLRMNGPEQYEIALQYIKEMNMNSLYLTDIQGSSQELYDLCDRNGLMVLSSWGPQWDWEDQRTWLQHHPSMVYFPCDSLSDITVQWLDKWEADEAFTNPPHLTESHRAKIQWESHRINSTQYVGAVQDFPSTQQVCYYAVKKANQPLQFLYDPDDRKVYLQNETLIPYQALKAVIQGYDVEGHQRLATTLPIEAKALDKVFLCTLDPQPRDVFVSMKLYNQAEEQIADNFYWISRHLDVRIANRMEMVDIRAKVEEKDSAKNAFTVLLENTSEYPALYMQLTLKDIKGNELKPVFWEDNYVSLLPGEKRTLSCTFGSEFTGYHQNFEQPVLLHIEGWNVFRQIISLSVVP